MPHGDGDRMQYGGTILGTGLKEKLMPQGVVCEELVDFSAGQFRQTTPKYVQAMLSEKGATDVYNQFVADVLTKQTWKKNFKWREVQAVVDSFKPRFQQVGMDVILCNCRASTGSEGVGFFYWFEYLDVNLQPAYNPPDRYDPSKDACCACSLM
mmetsp:Transcript_14195/g.22593  ORF Transcript_14195/g.22593 Transcript_14195/m.22593 type:complete len:154 (+) Transcript_14195:63-524(+)